MPSDRSPRRRPTTSTLRVVRQQRREPLPPRPFHSDRDPELEATAPFIRLPEHPRAVEFGMELDFTPSFAARDTLRGARTRMWGFETDRLVRRVGASAAVLGAALVVAAVIVRLLVP